VDSIRVSRTPFADYRAALDLVDQCSDRRGRAVYLVMGWDLLSRATGREVEPDSWRGAEIGACPMARYGFC